MKPRKKKYDLKQILSSILFASLVLSAAYTLVRMLSAPGVNDIAGEFDMRRSDYVLKFIQCVLGVVVMMLPTFINHKWSVPIPNFIYVSYYVFLYCAVFLGEVLSFYYRIPHWDKFLHFFSGLMLASLGFILVTLLNENTHGKVKLSPFFIALFAFCFALAMGAVWEIYEYTMDTLMGFNMQKYMTEAGQEFIGRLALRDTMEDLISDASAALIVSILGYFSVKRRQLLMNEP